MGTTAAGGLSPRGSAVRAGSPCARAARVYASRAASRSPASSSRCARTASSRWWPAIRLSPASESSSSRPARGPCTCAVAIARFSVTIGFGAIRSRIPYSTRICGQSVSAVLAASACTAAIAACSWYGPSAAVAIAPRSARCPRRSAPASHRARSCSASGTSAPSGAVRVARRESVSSISASRPARLAVVAGSSRCTSRVSRIASRGQLGALQVRAGRRGVALVEDQVQHLQHDREPLGPLGPAGSAKARAGVLDLLLGPADALGHRRLRARGTRARSARSSGRRPRAG